MSDIFTENFPETKSAFKNLNVAHIDHSWAKCLTFALLLYLTNTWLNNSWGVCVTASNSCLSVTPVILLDQVILVLSPRLYASTLEIPCSFTYKFILRVSTYSADDNDTTYAYTKNIQFETIIWGTNCDSRKISLPLIRNAWWNICRCLAVFQQTFCHLENVSHHNNLLNRVVQKNFS